METVRVKVLRLDQIDLSHLLEHFIDNRLRQIELKNASVWHLDFIP